MIPRKSAPFTCSPIKQFLITSKSPITQTLEASLLPAPKDSVGARILKKMGWRLGQGIGPRISLKQRKLQDALAYDATTGAKFQGSTLEIPDDDEEASKHKYAPRDTPVLVVKRKDNSHGLGYVPGMSLNETLGSNVAGSSNGPRLAGIPDRFFCIVLSKYLMTCRWVRPRRSE